MFQRPYEYLITVSQSEEVMNKIDRGKFPQDNIRILTFEHDPKLPQYVYSISILTSCRVTNKK